MEVVVRVVAAARLAPAVHMALTAALVLVVMVAFMAAAVPLVTPTVLAFQGLYVLFGRELPANFRQLTWFKYAVPDSNS
jgi:hypothetical protein